MWSKWRWWWLKVTRARSCLDQRRRSPRPPIPWCSTRVCPQHQSPPPPPAFRLSTPPPHHRRRPAVSSQWCSTRSANSTILPIRQPTRPQSTRTRTGLNDTDCSSRPRRAVSKRSTSTSSFHTLLLLRPIHRRHAPRQSSTCCLCFACTHLHAFHVITQQQQQQQQSKIIVDFKLLQKYKPKTGINWQPKRLSHPLTCSRRMLPTRATSSACWVSRLSR